MVTLSVLCMSCSWSRFGFGLSKPHLHRGRFGASSHRAREKLLSALCEAFCCFISSLASFRSTSCLLNGTGLDWQKDRSVHLFPLCLPVDDSQGRCQRLECVGAAKCKQDKRNEVPGPHGGTAERATEAGKLERGDSGPIRTAQQKTFATRQFPPFIDLYKSHGRPSRFRLLFLLPSTFRLDSQIDKAFIGLAWIAWVPSCPLLLSLLAKIQRSSDLTAAIKSQLGVVWPYQHSLCCWFQAARAFNTCSVETVLLYGQEHRVSLKWGQGAAGCKNIARQGSRCLVELRPLSKQTCLGPPP